MTPAQKMMIDDGLPASIVLMTQEQRHQAWEKKPPKAYAPFTDPRIEQDRQLREEEKKQKATQRIIKLKNYLAKKAAAIPFSTKGLQWDTKICKWIPEQLPTQEDAMAKLKITPYDAAGQVVERGKTSIKEDATQEQIDAQIRHAVKRGGASKIVRVEVTKENGEIVSSQFTVDLFKGMPAATNTAPEAEPGNDAQAAPEGQPEEADMAKRKVKKANGAAKKSNGVRAGSKTEAVAKLLKRSGGCTAKEVLALTKWPSVSMPAIAKNCGLKLRKEKKKGEGPTRYFGS